MGEEKSATCSRKAPSMIGAMPAEPAVRAEKNHRKHPCGSQAFLYISFHGQSRQWKKFERIKQLQRKLSDSGNHLLSKFGFQFVNPGKSADRIIAVIRMQHLEFDELLPCQ